ncbi:MAG: TonB-dependent receptor, partial [Pseudomonadota bacterium]
LPQTATSVECQTAQALAGGLDVCTLLNAGVAAQDVAQSVAATNRTTSVAFLPAVGVTLNWTDDLATSFTVKRGYRAGGAGRTFLSAQDFEFDPEFAWNYELGLRSTWLDDRLTVNANVFYFDWNNQQVSIDGPLGALDSLVVNAGSSRTFGGELEFFAAATDNLDLRGSVGYVNTRFTDFVNQGQVLTGNEFPNAPNWTAAVAAIYEFDSGFYIQADANYRSNAFTSADNNPGSFEDSRTLVNGKIGYRNDYLDAQIFATNLFDVDYIEHTSAATNTAKVGDGLFVGARVTVDLDFDG